MAFLPTTETDLPITWTSLSVVPIMYWWSFAVHPHRSSSVQLVRGVPQGSVLDTLLLIMYTVDLIALIERQGFRPHLY